MQPEILQKLLESVAAGDVIPAVDQGKRSRWASGHRNQQITLRPFDYAQGTATNK